MSAEARFAQTLVDLADTLVDDFDVVDLLTLLADRCVDVFDVGAAGVMLRSPAGELRVVASSSSATRVLELFERQSEEGPCPECFRTGQPVVNQDLSMAIDRWPEFAPRALEAGFRSVHAMPMHLRDLTIGAVNLFRADVGQLEPADVLTAQALADVATIAVIQHRAATESEVVNDRLRHALNVRIVVEQAEGIVAEQTGLSMDHSFLLLRTHANNHHRDLVDVAQDVIAGTLAAESLDSAVLE